MLKKLIAHATEIATNTNGYRLLPYQYPNGGGGVYVTDAHRILELEKPFYGIDINMHDEGIVSMIERHMQLQGSRELDYTRYELPSVEYFKKGIRDTVGRKRDSLIWSDGYITFNPRYLVKAMESLNAKVCYVSTNPTRECIFMYENDDLQSWNREAILPVINTYNNRGFWKKEDER